MTRLLTLVLTLLCLAVPARAERILAFAAASLAGPLDRVAMAYEAQSGNEVAISYAGSSALARQIEQGAPADVYLSANEGWMDHLAALGHVRNETRRDLWANRLVLVSSRAGEEIELTPDLDILALLDGQKLAVALTDSVPAGVYAQEALTSLGLWEGVKDSLAQADNVRAALALVSAGAAPCGIVYATDAAADPKVHVRGTFPEETHAPITYPGAVTATASETALSFLDFLSSDEARTIFEAAGFQVVPAP